jgi:hypothetical protein
MMKCLRGESWDCDVLKCCLVLRGMSVDHKRVYEEGESLSWCFVLVIQVTEVWPSKADFGASTYT